MVSLQDKHIGRGDCCNRKFSFCRPTQDPASRLRTFFDELVGSYINIFLLIFCVVLLVKILRKSFADSVDDMPRAPSLPPMKKRDFTLNELRQYDGKTGERRGERLHLQERESCLVKANRNPTPNNIYVYSFRGRRKSDFDCGEPQSDRRDPRTPSLRTRRTLRSVCRSRRF